MNDHLKGLLDQYEQRKAGEAAAKKLQDAAENGLRQATEQALESVVLPVLEGLSQELRSRGHKAAIAKRIGNYSNPHIEFQLSPVASDDARVSSVLKSNLVFIHRPNGKMGAMPSLSRDLQSSVLASSGTRTQEVETAEVTPEWVRSQTLRFISAVLEGS